MIKKTVNFLLIIGISLTIFAGITSVVMYHFFFEHVVTLARTSSGRELRKKAEELGLRKRSKEEKWIDRYDHSIEIVQQKKDILVNATYRGTGKLYQRIKNVLYWFNPFKKKEPMPTVSATESIKNNSYLTIKQSDLP